jgi:hypothetical protein
MATAAIGRRRPDRLEDDQALRADDVDDEEEPLPGKPLRAGSGENETTRAIEGSKQDAFFPCLR